MISIQGLSKLYGTFEAVAPLSLEVAKGEVFGFLGPNGAGKTTTIRMLMGILVPTAGRALIDGLDCQRDGADVKRHVGYLPDSPIYYDYLRGREILAFVAEMHGLSAFDADARARELLWELDLGDAAEEYAISVPAYFGPRPLRAAALGLGGAVVAAVVGVAYILLARRLAWFRAPSGDETRVLAGALAPLAIVAAPIFEEYIFRGLLFGGLARSVSPVFATLASAAIFAMVHPPLAVVPVFFMALVAATVYARAGILLAPVLVHAGYNAAVLAAQVWFGL